MGGLRMGFFYVLGVGGLSSALIALEWLRVDPSSPIEAAYLALLGLALVPVSILFVSTATYLTWKPMEFERVSLARLPRVAILYVVYNDLLTEAVAQTVGNLEYSEAEVWLVSDSTGAVALAEEEALPESVRKFRRAERRGGKPGALNDWLRVHGAGFDYVLPMDADAILARGSLRSLLEIAEHPANRHYAGFQTLMEIHPVLARTSFARLLGRGVKWGSRIVPLANQRIFGQGMYWGSNALLRTHVLCKVGGWVEGVLCEDFALTARLDAAGYPVALVDIYNFEGFPPDALSLRERTVRWCKANISVAPSFFRVPTSFAMRLNIVTPLLFYAMAPTLLSLLVINVVAPPVTPLHRFSTALGVALLAFVVLHRLVLVPRNRVSISAFLATLAVETLVVLGMSLRITWAYAVSLLYRPNSTWEPSRKRAKQLSLATAVRESIPELAFVVFLIGLIGVYRPALTSIVLASVWIVCFASSPIVLWWSSRTSVSTGDLVRTPSDAKDRTTSS